MNNTFGTSEVQERISTLWIVVMFNMAFADILTFITPGVLKGLMTGTAEGMPLTPGLLLAFAVLIEIPIAMIFLTKHMQPAVSRRANRIAPVVTILWIVGGGSLHWHYIFFCTVEVLCLLAILRSAWQWEVPNPKDTLKEVPR